MVGLTNKSLENGVEETPLSQAGTDALVVPSLPSTIVLFLSCNNHHHVGISILEQALS